MKVWKQAKKYGAKIAKPAAAVVTSGMVMIGNAYAELPPGADTAFAALGTDSTTLAGYAYPVLLTVLGFGVGMKLTKRFANKV